MNLSSGRSTDDIERILNQYGDMLLRIAVVMLKEITDAEDAVQETIIKYMSHNKTFSSKGHEKAWLITVITNQCRDMLRRRTSRQAAELEYIDTITEDKQTCGILEALMTLPEKFRIVMILHYVEEYKINEIADIINRTPSAVKMRLKKGRELLAEKYTKEFI